MSDLAGAFGSAENPLQDALFERIATALWQDGVGVFEEALPASLCDALAARARSLDADAFHLAGVGRELGPTVESKLRRDEICWIDGDSPAELSWLGWAERLRIYLNSRLFLGLFCFESHFAHYAQGAFYRRHLDAFRGQANRRLTLVLYLNPDWQARDGGELLVYAGDDECPQLRVPPRHRSLVVFLSEEFPHEVLPAKRDRYSIAGWFRINPSNDARVDPPR